MNEFTGETSPFNQRGWSSVRALMTPSPLTHEKPNYVVLADRSACPRSWPK